MPYYEFQDCDNPKCPTNVTLEGHKVVGHLFLIRYPMKDAPTIGGKVPCIRCGTGKVTRIASSGISGIVRGTNTPTINNGDTIRTKDCDGQQLDITFVDHPHTDPSYQAGLAEAAQRMGCNGLSKAYYSEKHGGLCVDVASNVPDPLGRFKGAEQSSERVQVNQPIRRRPKSKASGKPRARTYCPVRKGI